MLTLPAESKHSVIWAPLNRNNNLMNDVGEEASNGRIPNNIMRRQWFTGINKTQIEGIAKNKVKENMGPQYKETIPSQLFTQVFDNQKAKNGYNDMTQKVYKRLLEGLDVYIK